MLELARADLIASGRLACSYERLDDWTCVFALLEARFLDVLWGIVMVGLHCRQDVVFGCLQVLLTRGVSAIGGR